MENVVQFIHAGVEHAYVSGQTHKEANPAKDGAHERNFIRAKGRYVGTDGKPVDSTLCFWGEWENEADVQKLAGTGNDGLPKHVITPVPVKEGTLPCNTDPFVFGKCFKYFWCHQGNENGSLRKLEKGDLILFGSKKDGGFVLDTVFVVDRAIPYTTGSFDGIKNALDKEDFEFFRRNSLDSILAPADCGSTCVSGGTEAPHTFYTGATIENPVDGMYSFAPAQTEQSCPNGFVRITLTGNQVPGLSGELSQNFKVIKGTNVNAVWNAILKAVTEQGLVSGVEFEL